MTLLWTAALAAALAAASAPQAPPGPRSSAEGAAAPQAPPGPRSSAEGAAAPQALPGPRSSAEGAAERPLDAELGRLLVVTANPRSAPGFEKALRAGEAGGVLLRVSDSSAEQVAELTARLQGWAGAEPLLVAVDNEGGPQFTLRAGGLTVFPSNMARGATYSDMYAYLAAYFSARELRALGITMNLAPVLDVNTNPRNPIIGLRSFGGSPQEVASLGTIAVEGSWRGGVAPVAKHFPGHGDTVRDSHAALPVVTHPRSRLESVELFPFRAAVQAGVPAVMTAHVAYPALDPSGLPATLSRPILQGVLRDELGFEGVVITDSLDMRAITDRWSIPQAAVLAVAAGADLLLLGRGELAQVRSELRAALSDGRLSEARVREAAGRVRTLAAELGSGRRRMDEADRERGRDLARAIADRSVTVLQDSGGLLPIPADRRPLAVLFLPPGYEKEAEALRQAFAQRHPRAEVRTLSHDPAEPDVARALEAAAGADLLVVGVFHGGRARHAAQVEAAQRLLDLGRPAVLVSLMNPFDQAHFKPAARIATYGLTDASMRALARVLFGEQRALGLLPVQVERP